MTATVDQYLPTSGAVGPNLKLRPTLKTLLFSLMSTGKVTAPHAATVQVAKVLVRVPKPYKSYSTKPVSQSRKAYSPPTPIVQPPCDSLAVARLNPPIRTA